MSKFDDLLKGPPVPEPSEPKRLKPGDPHPPPDALSKLREFIPCRRGLTWEWLQEATGFSADLQHTLTVSKTWTHPTAPEHFAKRVRPELWKGGPLIADGNVVLGSANLEFCKAVKTLLDEGELQVLPGGLMQHAIDPVTGYWYQYPVAPKLPGLHVTITPGD